MPARCERDRATTTWKTCDYSAAFRTRNLRHSSPQRRCLHHLLQANVLLEFDAVAPSTLRCADTCKTHYSSLSGPRAHGDVEHDALPQTTGSVAQLAAKVTRKLLDAARA